MQPISRSAPPPARRLPAILASALALLLALLGCALTAAQGSKTIPPTATGGKAPVTPTVHEIAQTTTLPFNITGPVTATCPPGEIALGGGWSIPRTRINRVLAAKATGNAWSVYVTNPPLNGQNGQNVAAHTGQAGAAPASAIIATPEGTGVTVTAYVECLAGAPGAIVTQRATTDNFAPTPDDTFNDKLGGFISLCDPGEILVGGGFDLGGPSANLEIEANSPSTDIPFVSVPAWVFSMRNYDTTPHAITRYAECLSGVATSVSYPRQEGSPVYANQTATVVAPCPTDALLAGGGFGYRMHSPGDARLGNLFSLHASPSGWQGLVLTLSGYGLFYLTSHARAVCLTFPAAVHP
jgi:hypothetical protein